MITDFKKVTPLPKNSRELQKCMQNWRTIHEYIADMEDLPGNVKTLGDMLAMELKRKEGARHHILYRLHMRLNRMRGRVEQEQVLKHAKNP